MNKFECIKGVFGSDLKPRARLVLQCLIYHADKDGFCFPTRNLTEGTRKDFYDHH